MKIQQLAAEATTDAPASGWRGIEDGEMIIAYVERVFGERIKYDIRSVLLSSTAAQLGITEQSKRAITSGYARLEAAPKINVAR
jgi:hypothetical protein